jgi:hypothetical protein
MLPCPPDAPDIESQRKKFIGKTGIGTRLAKIHEDAPLAIHNAQLHP